MIESRTSSILIRFDLLRKLTVPYCLRAMPIIVNPMSFTKRCQFKSSWWHLIWSLSNQNSPTEFTMHYFSVSMPVEIGIDKKKIFVSVVLSENVYTEFGERSWTPLLSDGITNTLKFDDVRDTALLCTNTHARCSRVHFAEDIATYAQTAIARCRECVLRTDRCRCVASALQCTRKHAHFTRTMAMCTRVRPNSPAVLYVYSGVHEWNALADVVMNELLYYVECQGSRSHCMWQCAQNPFTNTKHTHAHTHPLTHKWCSPRSPLRQLVLSSSINWNAKLHPTQR